MHAIQISNLTKTFGKGDQAVQALKNVNLNVPQGLVFGFLGPNGAGKTTTIRILMDLIRPTSGQAAIFGQDTRNNQTALRRVGALVENPSFYGYMTGRENLTLLARTANNYDPKRIDLLLEQVGIAKNADRAVKGYSMGMKQRLGIAATLLSDPDLVLLDEPTNGLDPAGIQEMRAFIRNLAHEEGKTVFLSSHLLHEVEQVCDQVAIINLGKIIQQGTVTELLTQSQTRIQMQLSPMDKAAKILAAHHPAQDGKWLTLNIQADQVPGLVKELALQDIQVHQIMQKGQSLEEFFISVTQNGEVDDA